MSIYYKWYVSFFGYSKIKIKGQGEKLLNALLEKKIYFWGTVLEQDGDFSLCGSVLSAGQILDTADELGFETEIIQRKGLPFLFEKYKKRYGIFVGMVLAWAILFLSSLTVWEVRVAERSGEDPAHITALLEECGLSMGTFLPSLNVRAVENQFLLNNPEYSFLAVNIYGTVANIEIRRATKMQEPENKDEICDVVAGSSGTVISVEAYGGFPVVKKGDYVSQGDMLISSLMEGSFGVTRQVHAYGKVIAAVSYEYQVEIPLRYEAVVPTGKETSKTSVNVLCFGADLFLDESSPYEKCTVDSFEKRLDIFGIMLPIQVERAVYREQKTETVNGTPQLAEQKALKDFEDYKKREIKGEILSEATEGVLDSERGVFVFKGFLTVAEDIGIKSYLGSF